VIFVTFNCIFCGKKVEEDSIKANGFCKECNLANEYALEVSNKIRADQGILCRVYKKDGTEIILSKEDWEKIDKQIQKVWFNSIMYGDKRKLI